jgi:hypothetical protein
MAEFIDDLEMERMKNMLQELLEVDEGLYDNEIEFLDSLTNWNGNYTEGQAGWLEKIWNRIFR